MTKGERMVETIKKLGLDDLDEPVFCRPQGVTRRTALATIASVPVVAKVDIDSLTPVEADLLVLAARDFKDAKILGTDEKTLRAHWDVDPAKYPLLAKEDEAYKIFQLLATRGLVEKKGTYGMLPDGQMVDYYFVATERGRAALTAHFARATT